MRSPYILILLFAFFGLSQASIYWLKYTDMVQIHSNLVFFAREHKGTDLFYALVQRDSQMDHFLNGLLGPRFEDFEVQETYETENKNVYAIVSSFDHIHSVKHLLLISLSPSSTSPTGYIMERVEICVGNCDFTQF
ncbi:hypothetical protein B9Z55_006960 [Caenorhabditis nigoni]|uniref:Uncharacterized protein n=1 Tax=Caenorhabditis nigoni TaxID=1611254 RepID=A0A2G5V7M0_9PELO|nr:hypothetical protein B9Z55_006960 [Caenorhabditis nigoni]